MKKIVLFFSFIFVFSFLLVLGASANNTMIVEKEGVRLKQRIKNRIETRKEHLEAKEAAKSGEDVGSVEVEDADKIKRPVLRKIRRKVRKEVREEMGDEMRDKVRPAVVNKLMERFDVENVADLREVIKERRRELRKEVAEHKDEIEKEVLRKHNTVREAVQALLSSEKLAGGIGPQISAIAKEFDNSVQKTLKREVKMRKRSRLRRFFFGGDRESAKDLVDEVKRNRERVQKLKKLEENCSDCADDVKEVIAEQLDNIDKEQTRLEKVAEKEVKVRGIFGWFRGLFGGR